MLDLKFWRSLIYGFEIGKNKLLRHYAFPSAQTYILLGSVQNEVDAPLKILDWVLSWMWISKPITVSQGIGSSLLIKKLKWNIIVNSSLHNKVGFPICRKESF